MNPYLRFGTKEFERIREELEKAGKLTTELKELRKVSPEQLKREFTK